MRLSGKQGIALRGHGDEKTGSLWNLLWLVGRYNNDVNSYLNSESKSKFLSTDIQNEMLKIIISQTILRKLMAAIKDEY